MTDWQILGLETGASLEVVKKAYIALAKQHHPDIGGDAEKFVVTQMAYARLIKQLTTPKICKTCNGSGVALATSGFHSIPVTCQECGGDGKVCAK